MKPRFLLAVFCLALLALPAVCQENGGGKQTASEPAGEGNLIIWRWLNFVILVGGLGYLIGKNAGPFFESRARKIRQEMMDAEEVRADAEKRAADVDRRLANLESEIAALRAESQREAESERQRIQQQTAADMVRIRAHAEQEIAAAGKAARQELKRYSLELAIGLAEQKLRAQVAPDTEDTLVRSFASDLDGFSKAQLS